MLLPKGQDPWNCAYVLGAVVLDELRDEPLDFLALHQRMSARVSRSLSSTQLVSALAWLYLINAVSMRKDGAVERCS